MPILALPAADITDPENLVITESQISDFGDYLLRSGGTVTGDIGMSGNRITGLPTPVNSSEPANKSYVDSIASGLSWKVPVLDKHRTTPPAAPTAGDRHIVADGATGAWNGQDDTIAEWNGSAWEFTVVGDGWVVFVDDTDRYFRFDGDTATWVGLSTALDHNSLTGLADGDPHTQYLNDARAVIWLATQGLDALGVRNAGDLNAGTLLDARVAETNVTQHQAALSLTRSQISDFGGPYLPLTGGTLSGNLSMGGNRINGVDRLGFGTTALVSLHLGADSPVFRFSDLNAASQQETTGFFEWYRGASTERVGYFGYGSTNNANIQLANETTAGGVEVFTNSVRRLLIDSAGLTTFSGNVAMSGNNITGANLIEADSLVRTPTMYFVSNAPQFRMYDTNGPDANDWLNWIYNTEVFNLQWRDQSASTYYDLIRVNCSSSPTGTLYGNWTVGGVLTVTAMDLSGLPTSDPAIAGRPWNDSGTVKISAG